MNEKALEKILNIFLEKVLPLTEKGVARGSKIFGAAIIKKPIMSRFFSSIEFKNTRLIQNQRLCFLN